MICAVANRIKIAVCLLGPAAILKWFSLHYLLGFIPVK